MLFSEKPDHKYYTYSRFKIHSKVESYYTQLTGELTNYN